MSDLPQMRKYLTIHPEFPELISWAPWAHWVVWPRAQCQIQWNHRMLCKLLLTYILWQKQQYSQCISNGVMHKAFNTHLIPHISCTCISQIIHIHESVQKVITVIHVKSFALTLTSIKISRFDTNSNPHMDSLFYSGNLKDARYIDCGLRPSLIAKFMGPSWGPSGADRTRWTPCWPHELCYLVWPW